MQDSIRDKNRTRSVFEMFKAKVKDSKNERNESSMMASNDLDAPRDFGDTTDMEAQAKAMLLQLFETKKTLMNKLKREKLLVSVDERGVMMTTYRYDRVGSELKLYKTDSNRASPTKLHEVSWAKTLNHLEFVVNSMGTDDISMDEPNLTPRKRAQTLSSPVSPAQLRTRKVYRPDIERVDAETDQDLKNMVETIYQFNRWLERKEYRFSPTVKGSRRIRVKNVSF